MPLIAKTVLLTGTMRCLGCGMEDTTCYRLPTASFICPCGDSPCIPVGPQLPYASADHAQEIEMQGIRRAAKKRVMS